MKKIIAFLVCFVVIISTAITAFAAEIEPYYNNTRDVNTKISISSSGYATVSNAVYSASGMMTSAEIETKIQKKFGLIWVNVSGASWVDTTTSPSFSKSHSFQLTEKDTYRAHVVFKISGNGGSDDKITKNVECVY